jgi:DNA-binding NarL/FixJ family response regulator
MNNSSIIIADDHPLFREAIIHLLNRLSPELQVHTTDTLKGSLSLLKENPDVSHVLFDLSLPDSKGIEGILRLKKAAPDVALVVISANHDVSMIAQAIKSGASSYIPKNESMETITSALTTVLNGKKWFPEDYKEHAANADQNNSSIFNDLTPTQLKVLFRLRNGENNKTIAEGLFITEATVKAHITAIFRKLGVRNRTQVVIATQHLDS